MTAPLAVGIDIGTSGVRIVALAPDHSVRAFAKAEMDTSPDQRSDPALWGHALETVCADLLSQIAPAEIGAICVDGTSGTVVALDGGANPVGKALMYNDVVDDPAILGSIKAVAPRESAVHGASSALARAMALQDRPGVRRIVHQADWIAERLSGKPLPSDESNALKTGYDPVRRIWPDWMAETSVNQDLLPDVVAVGTQTGVTGGCLGFPARIPIVAGMSDGCASFLATGATEPGDGVTALGTTMTIKLLSDRPVFAPEYGIYSHRIGDLWLAGGASNSGGGALSKHFTPEQIAALSTLIDPASESGFSYYPLPRPGERFPINDPTMLPREAPRPKDDRLFLHGLLEGIARIEALGYQRLMELGAPSLKSIRTVGGGASNPVWTTLRSGLLKVPVQDVNSGEAAAGSAHLALVFLEQSR